MRTLALTVVLSALAACEGDALPKSALLDVTPESDAGATDSGAAPRPGSDASAVDAATTDASDADAGEPSFPPTCDPAATFGSGTKVLNGQGPKNKVLAAITSDELSLAWMDGSGAHVADRPTTSDAFGQGVDVEVPSNARIVLTQDGLGVYAVSSDGHSIVEHYRQGKLVIPATPGQHLLIVSASDYQELKNMEDVAPIKPNTTTFRHSVTVH